MYVGVYTHARACILISYACLTYVRTCVCVCLKDTGCSFSDSYIGVAADSSLKFVVIGKELPTFRRIAVSLSCCVKMTSAIHRNVGNRTGQHILTFQNVYVFKTR